MSNFSKYIPEDLAKELLEFGMPLELYDVGSYCSYLTPTYGEVIDWFSCKGIHITFDAFFSFALADNVGYLWKISLVRRTSNEIWLDEFCEEKLCSRGEACGGSFELDANAAIRYAMKLKKILDI